MSVLVEALGLIVPRMVLDVSYPGGADAFIRELSEADAPCRRFCADEQLVSVSFDGRDDAQSIAIHLCNLGIIAVDDHRYQELAFVDHACEPSMPCDWLELRHHEEAFTSCWMAGTDPGHFHAPASWILERSPALATGDIRDEPGRCMLLADEDGRETWLDFVTGAIISGLPPREVGAEWCGDHPAHLSLSQLVPARDEARESADALLGVVRSALDRRGINYQQTGRAVLHLVLQRQSASYLLLFTADAKRDFLTLVASYGSKVPAARRVEMAKATSFINKRIGVGNLELDFADGEVRLRVRMDVEGGILTERMVDNLLGDAMHAMERFHQPIMQVAFGGVDPEIAIMGA